MYVFLPVGAAMEIIIESEVFFCHVKVGLGQLPSLMTLQLRRQTNVVNSKVCTPFFLNIFFIVAILFERELNELQSGCFLKSLAAIVPEISLLKLRCSFLWATLYTCSTAIPPCNPSLGLQGPRIWFHLATIDCP